MQHVAEGKLWLDGSGRVSVLVTVSLRRVKVIVSMADKREDIWKMLVRMFPPFIANELEEKFALRILSSAERARQDPEQLAELARAKKRIVSGRAKSRAALDKRILGKKEIAFKAAVQDLIRRGKTQRQLYGLIREAFVEGVHLT